VFDFCWTLFVRVKADFPAISDDLVTNLPKVTNICILYSNFCHV
jgi:hypothetical protein